jgi:Fe2+ or Zn2+ uptake regulation protein
MHEASVPEIARAILDYLRKNPEARDTLSGIAQWWLPADQIKPRTATIKEALDELVAAGLISEHKGKDAQVSYRLSNHDLQNPGDRA